MKKVIAVGTKVYLVVGDGAAYTLQERTIAKITDKHFKLNAPFGKYGEGHLRFACLDSTVWLTPTGALHDFAKLQRQTIAVCSSKIQKAHAAVDWAMGVALRGGRA